MIRLLKIEWAKISTYKPFWVLTALYLILSPLVMLSVHNVNFPFFPSVASAFYSFPMGWNVAAWTAGWFQILLGIMLVIFISNEFNYKTTRQHIIDGMTRNEYYTSKLVLILLISTMATLYMALNAIIGSFIFANGLTNVMDGIEYVPIFLFQTIGYLSIALLFSFLLRSSGYAILIFICVIVGEWIVRLILGANGFEVLSAMAPIGIISNMTPIPFLSEVIEMSKEQSGEEPFVLSLSERLGYGSIYILSYLGLTYYNLKKKMI